MATGSSMSSRVTHAISDSTWDRVGAHIRAVLTPLASLKWTVALFAMGFLLVFVGTLAQVDKDMLEVMDDYFKAWFARIELKVFFPRSWVSWTDQVPGAFWFPGGALVGTALCINLIAAHLIRFKIQAQGQIRWLGLAILLFGVVVAYVVIANGQDGQGLQGLPSFRWETFWLAIKLTIAACALLSGLVVALHSQLRTPQRLAYLSFAILTGGVAVWLFAQGGGGMPSPSSLRVLWQLTQGGLSGLILLVACFLLFHKRAGIVLLHAGVGLIMASEFLVTMYAVEEQMSIREGETVNFARDIREVELAIIDANSAESDQVTVIAESKLQQAFEGKVAIKDDRLPFDIQIPSLLENADLRPLKENETTFANEGIGARYVAEPKRSASGAESGEVDMAACHVELFKKGSNESLGRHLLSVAFSEQELLDPVMVENKPYQICLRFKRSYKPYRMALRDVRKDDYLGTNTPRNYSSEVRLVDSETKLDSEFKIWMNNPLRFRGETFYQSNYGREPEGREVTTLQVVTNLGWMMPYVGCMWVFFGMTAHFALTLGRFLGRTQRENSSEKLPVSQPLKQKRVTEERGTPDASRWSQFWGLWKIPASIALILGLLILGQIISTAIRRPKSSEFQLAEFGKLPIVHEGRTKPIDTLARNLLRIASDKETFVDADGKTQPAVRWLLDIISGSEAAEQHRVFRIEHPRVLETLGLERRKGLRYAESEFLDRLEDLEKEVIATRDIDKDKLDIYQRKLIELDKRLRAVGLLRFAFRPIAVTAMPSREEFEQNPESARQQVEAIVRKVAQQEEALRQMSNVPLVVPDVGEREWESYAVAGNRAVFDSIQGQSPTPSTLAWASMLADYRGGKVSEFNTALQDYRRTLERSSALDAVHAPYQLEHFFNHSRMFTLSMALYIVSFLMVCAAWLGHRAGQFGLLNRMAMATILVAFLVHTIALGMRIYISGRPPVTNLYSSAVFIGWAGVLFGLGLEAIFKISIGNVVAAICGFATLKIAYQLAAEGDTFTVLQAVLDTQFWLATHVVCISLGYSTTFIAGALAVVYLIGGGPFWPKQVGKEVASMIYGVLCFAILFSFVGTVLGGLWADDSWGRFWGWDPKENGALMIVIWNALILHARWGGLIKQQGMAVLAVLGNIVTAWSWFGVNELGVGLHSYGFTEGVLRNLAIFMMAQLAVIAVGTVCYVGAKQSKLRPA